VGKFRLQVFGLRCEDTEPGVPPENVLDLSQQDPRRGEVAQGEVTPRQFEPRLGGKVWQRMGQGWAEPLRLG